MILANKKKSAVERARTRDFHHASPRDSSISTSPSCYDLCHAVNTYLIDKLSLLYCKSIEGNRGKTLAVCKSIKKWNRNIAICYLVSKCAAEAGYILFHQVNGMGLKLFKIRRYSTGLEWLFWKVFIKFRWPGETVCSQLRRHTRRVRCSHK